MSAPVTEDVRISGESGGGVPAAKVGCCVCSHVITAGCIRCGRCGGAHHAERVCLGIAQPTIDELLSNSDGTIAYMCFKCRVPSDSSGPTGRVEDSRLSLMYEMLLGVVTELREQ